MRTQKTSEQESRTVSNYVFLKYSILCFLIISFTFPALASADELTSSSTVTTRKVPEKPDLLNEAPV
jgi:hypothetical protein